MTVTKDQAQMLATLAAASRPHGARRWDTAGTMAAIAKVADRNLGDVIMATIRAAADRDCESPGVIPSSGPHWREQLKPQPFTPRILTAGERCSICSMSETSCRLRHSVDDHEFESAAMAAKRAEAIPPEAISTAIAALREDLPVTKPATPPRTLDELAEANPALHAKVDALRDALPKPPPLREPEPPNPPAESVAGDE
jgi:hypothetical protein